MLLSRILADGHVTPDEISGELGVTTEKLDGYQTGRERIPLNLQARLALFVIASLPGFLKQGNQLRQQVAAAIAFEIHETKTHSSPPLRLR